jgi:hypothetical protein
LSLFSLIGSPFRHVTRRTRLARIIHAGSYGGASRAAAEDLDGVVDVGEARLGGDPAAPGAMTGAITILTTIPGKTKMGSVFIIDSFVIEEIRCASEPYD